MEEVILRPILDVVGVWLHIRGSPFIGPRIADALYVGGVATPTALTATEARGYREREDHQEQADKTHDLSFQGNRTQRHLTAKASRVSW